MISFENILRLKGFPLDQAKRLINEFEILPLASRQQWIEKRRNDILEYHIENNPFYKSFLNKLWVKEWNSVPILKKSDLQRPLSEVLTPGFRPKDIYVSNTSGSSGHPFFFARDRFTHALVWAYVLENYLRLGITSKSKQARFYGIPLQRSAYYLELIKDRFMNRKRFIVFDLGDQMLGKFLKRFKGNRFHYIYGYTNSMMLFAKYLDSRKMVLKSECPSLELCIATSEMCTQEDKDYLSRVFGVPVVREYGASELDVIAIENSAQRWSINESNLFVEVLDENDQPVADGEQGRLIITSLFNKAMPFIRYEVGDIGAIGRDEKGSYLRELFGRTNDTILLPSGKRSPGFTFYYISRNILESSGVLKEFIIRQTALNTVEFDVVTFAPLTEKESKQIKEIMDKYLEPGLNLKINVVEKIVRPASGKIKHFYSEISS